MKNWTEIKGDLWEYICTHSHHNRVWARILDDHKTYVQRNFGMKSSIFISDMTKVDRDWLQHVEKEIK